jgi:hypothetical protein
MNTARIINPRLLRSGRERRASEPLGATDIFIARAEARAALFAAGELNLHDAVDALQAAAIAFGLVASIGQDAVQAIMAEALRKARRDD